MGPRVARPYAAGVTVVALLDPSGEPRVVDPTAPVLRADDLGVVRGEAVFETMRIAGGRAAFLEAHLRRLALSAARVAIELPTGWERLAEVAVHAYGEQDGVLRMTCTKGPPGGAPVGFAVAGAIPADTLRGREQGVRAITLTLGVSAGVRATAPWLLGGVKSTSYAVNMASIRHAQAEGVEDAIWVSTDGEVLEAPTSSVAWVSGGRLVSPAAAEVAILPGTTLDVALGLCERLGTPVEVRRGTVSELRAADEVLMLSSVRGVAPVIELDGRHLGIGPVTRSLREALEAALLL
jgi:4-amino-4-deoxychorismate lyase